MTNNQWLNNGMPIDAVDKIGNHLHVGDICEFDPEEWGGCCVFRIAIKSAEIAFPGAPGDLSSFVTRKVLWNEVTSSDMESLTH